MTAQSLESALGLPRLRYHCTVVITMPDGSKGRHTGYYHHASQAYDKAKGLFPFATSIKVEMDCARSIRYTCEELGVCQSLRPACNGCTPNKRLQLQLAPGVVDGPYHHARGFKSWWRAAVLFLLGRVHG